VIAQEAVYRTSEFAERAGVSVRTLHHYDRIGLLCPARSGGGYRLYRDSDLLRLEQIVVLKFLGLGLSKIQDLLAGEPAGLLPTLKKQRLALEEKRRRLDTAVLAIREAEQAAVDTGHPGLHLLENVIKVIEMQNDMDWVNRYYSEEGKAKLEERKHLWSPELQARVEREWADLFRDVEAALDEDPAGEKAQALAARWTGLVGQFTGGDPEIAKGLRRLYADRPNWPSGAQERVPRDPRLWDFIGRAIEAGKK
jgi:MerR family transcriptional regulator, thiopeptide resistance regulator